MISWRRFDINAIDNNPNVAMISPRYIPKPLRLWVENVIAFWENIKFAKTAPNIAPRI